MKISKIENCGECILLNALPCLHSIPNPKSKWMASKRGLNVPGDACPLESLEAHDEKVRAEEKAKYDAALADYKRLFAQEIGNLTIANEYHITLANRLRKENDALLANQSAVRAATIDEMVRSLSEEFAQEFDGRLLTVRYIAKQLKEGK